MDEAGIGSGDSPTVSSSSSIGIDIDLVIEIEGARVCVTRCRTIVFAEECRSIEVDISASAIFSISEDIAVIESEDGASF